MLYHILCMEIQRYPIVNMDWLSLFICVIVTALFVYLIRCILAHSLSMYQMCTCGVGYWVTNYVYSSVVCDYHPTTLLLMQSHQPSVVIMAGFKGIVY